MRLGRVNKIKEELAKEDPDEEVLEVKLICLEDYAEKMIQLDNVIFDALLDANATDTELDEEIYSCEEYNKELVTMRYAVRRLLSNKERSVSPCLASVRSLVEAVSNREEKTNRLPKLELEKLGDLLEVHERKALTCSGFGMTTEENSIKRRWLW